MIRTLETALAHAPNASSGQAAGLRNGDGLAGISSHDFEVMRSAALRVLEADGDADTSAVTGSLRELLEGAGPDAAGKVSAGRATYDKVAGAHWCVMAHLPHVER
ncbi:hypothetical protein [Spirillospora sp. CA-294931]|uniref:hypothetical protein n=1 Tax=Spirillospora sp. CA-294931 TaxID=3240042 RepID=UPI003D8D6618